MHKCFFAVLLLRRLAADAADLVPHDSCQNDGPVSVSLLQVALTLTRKPDDDVAAAPKEAFTNKKQNATLPTDQPAEVRRARAIRLTDFAQQRRSTACAAERQPFILPYVPLLIPSFSLAMWLMVLTMACVFVGYLLLGLLLGRLIRQFSGSGSTTPTLATTRPPAEETLANAASATKTTAKASDPILALDGLRVVATLLVLQYHWRIAQDEPNREFFQQIGRGLMEFFFGLSGFVTMLVVQDRVDRFNIVSGAFFFLKRMGRFCPLYYLALLMMVLWFVSQFYLDPLFRSVSWSQLTWEAFPIQAAFAQGLWPVNNVVAWDGNLAALNANTPGWFVSNSIILAAAFPWFFNICPRNVGSCLFGLATMLIADVLFVGVCLEYYFPCNPTLQYYWVGCRVPLFVAGMLSARISKQLPPSLLSWKGWGWVFDGSVLLYTAITMIVPIDGIGLFLILVEHILPSILCLVLISAHAVPRSEGMPAAGVLGKCLSCAPVVALSRYTFAVYILQFPVLRVLNKLLPLIPGSTSSFYPWQFLVVNWIVPLIPVHIVGAAAHHMFELPTQRLADAYLRWVADPGAATQ